MRHCPDGAPAPTRTPPCWTAAATRPRSDTPRSVSTRMTRTNRNPTGRECRGALPLGRAVNASQGVVGTVAERLAAARLAPAEPNLLGGHGGKRDRRHSSALMRAVTKGLRGAAPARTPEVPFPGLDIDTVRFFLRGYRTVHNFSPASALASLT